MLKPLLTIKYMIIISIQLPVKASNNLLRSRNRSNTGLNLTVKNKLFEKRQSYFVTVTATILVAPPLGEVAAVT
jgi:hypothetical protein